ncbi:MAG: viperin family antiviral radical SAM protein [Myxococcota bacterium]
MSTQPKPVSVNFHLWPKCNLKCRFCYAGFPAARRALPTDDARRVIDLLAGAGTEKLTFVGGEPTLHPDLTELVRHAAGLGLTTCIVTNGAKLSRVLEEAGDAVRWVGLSVDSGSEAVQAALGRGDGTHVGRSIALADEIRARGVHLKLNTVVTALNWQEDMSPLVRRMRPERWKAFQVLRVEGENNGRVEPLLITPDQYQAFVARNAHLAAEGLPLVPEDNDAMRGSYVMVDPQGRFFNNEFGRYTVSQPILTVGVEAALAQVGWRADKFEARGGRYNWRGDERATAREFVVAIEGLDGCGKSTTVQLLAERLGARIIHNPPRELAVERADADRLPPEERRAWYLRANRVAMDLARATVGQPVVLDRSVASTLTFGAAERGTVAQPGDVPAGLPLPDLIVLLQVPEDVRRQRHGDRHEAVTGEELRLATDDLFRARVVRGYENLCAVRVDATGTPEAVVEAVMSVVASCRSGRADGGFRLQGGPSS